MRDRAASVTRAPQDSVHIVGDDAAALRSVDLLLRASGLQAITHASADELLRHVARVAPGCLLVDLQSQNRDACWFLAELARRGCRLPAVIIVERGDVPFAVRAMKAGAVDVVEKPYSPDDVLRAVAGGVQRLRQEQRQAMLVASAEARMAGLTPRERDVLARLVDGHPNKLIAQALGISPRTVEIHRANLMEKLACRSLAEAVRLALLVKSLNVNSSDVTQCLSK